MRNTILIQILKTLSKKEFREFERLVNSPFFSSGRNYFPFLRELKKLYPEFNSDKLDKNYLHSRLYPGSKYNNQVMKNLINGLTRLAEEFLFQINIKKEKADYYTMLSEELKIRRVFAAGMKNIKKAYSALKESGIDTAYFKKMFQILEIEKEIYRNQNNNTAHVEKFRQSTLIFLCAYISQMVLVMHEMRAHLSNENFYLNLSVLTELAESETISKINNFLNENLLEYTAANSIFSNLLKLYSGKINEDLFYGTWKLFSENRCIFNRAGQNHIYGYLQNISISLGAVNRDKYRAETFRLMKEMLENNVFSASEDLPMSPSKFRNILIAALDAKEYRWCEDFISDYIRYLPNEHMENMFNYSIAKICFAKKQFEESLTYLIKVKYEMFALKYDIKALTLCIYYELGYFEEALSLIDTFKHFISDNKSLSERRKEVQHNFVNFTSELFKAKAGNKEIDLIKLRKKISGTNSVLNKLWLLEKINELI